MEQEIKLTVRLPKGVKQWLSDRAAGDGRSMNAELLHILEGVRKAEAAVVAVCSREITPGELTVVMTEDEFHKNFAPELKRYDHERRGVLVPKVIEAGLARIFVHALPLKDHP